ncbi:hypothetical protein LTR66_001141 [Elasticomyces elasticus]|nr:hypothetical protein LTR50_004073 [Elasticomyces elasticus]KAK4999914.1 hypothetical protein LTR66_001141 [Elasticomyces elasticus]
MPPTPLNLLRPLYLLSLSAFFLIPTTFDLIRSFQLSKLFSWSAFQDEWFAHFWSYFGPLARQNADAAVKPLMKQASGIVIDVGPGSGQWLDLFDRSNVSKIYGVEPNAGHHAALRANVNRAGLDGLYEIIGAGVEDLESFGIAKESVDTVVTVQVLCSVPGPRSVITSLYPYLKPGGKWIVYEHVKTKYHQRFVNPDLVIPPDLPWAIAASAGR